MTFQCKKILKRIRKLSNNEPIKLHYQNGLIRVHSDLSRVCDCSDLKVEMITILKELSRTEYLEFGNNGVFNLTHLGIHPHQYTWDKMKSFLFKSFFVPVVVAFFTSLITFWISSQFPG